MASPTQEARHFFDSARATDSVGSFMDSVVSPVALLLALRWADAHDGELEAMARFNGEEHEGILPKRCVGITFESGPSGRDRSDFAEGATAAWNMIRRAVGVEDRKPSKPRMMPRGRLLQT